MKVKKIIIDDWDIIREGEEIKELEKEFEEVEEHDETEEIAEECNEISEEEHGGNELTEQIDEQRYDKEQDEEENEHGEAESTKEDIEEGAEGEGEMAEGKAEEIEETDESKGNDDKAESEETVELTEEETGGESITDEEAESGDDKEETETDGEEEGKSEGEGEEEDTKEKKEGNKKEKTEEENRKEDKEEGGKEENGEETEDEEEGYLEEDEEETLSIGEKNTIECFNAFKKTVSPALLRYEFYRTIDSIAEVKTKIDDFTKFDELSLSINLLMKRVLDRRNIKKCYASKIRDNIILILDNSGSMTEWMDMIWKIANIAVKRKDIEIIVAPNGWDNEGKIERLMKEAGRTIIYVGDYDGADTPIELSWKNKVYWICTENRYFYFSSHNWVSYSEDAFKGMFFRCFSEKTLLKVFKRMRGGWRKGFYEYEDYDAYTDD